jgi:hypothetical protein
MTARSVTSTFCSPLNVKIWVGTAVDGRYVPGPNIPAIRSITSSAREAWGYDKPECLGALGLLVISQRA